MKTTRLDKDMSDFSSFWNKTSSHSLAVHILCYIITVSGSTIRPYLHTAPAVLF